MVTSIDNWYTIDGLVGDGELESPDRREDVRPLRSLPSSPMNLVPQRGLEPRRAWRLTNFQGWPVCQFRHCGMIGSNGEAPIVAKGGLAVAVLESPPSFTGIRPAHCDSYLVPTRIVTVEGIADALQSL